MEEMKVLTLNVAVIFSVVIYRVIFSKWLQIVAFHSRPVLSPNSPPCHFNTSQPVINPRHQTRSFHPQWSFEQVNNPIHWHNTSTLEHNASSRSWSIKLLIRTKNCLKGLLITTSRFCKSQGEACKWNWMILFTLDPQWKQIIV